jgi:hypothetical protein
VQADALQHLRSWQPHTERSRSRQVARRAEHEVPRRGRWPWPSAGRPAHLGPGRRCSDDAATARRPAGRATAHPARPCSGRQRLILARDPRPPASPRDRQRDARTRRPEGPPQAPRLTRRTGQSPTTATPNAAATSSSEHSTTALVRRGDELHENGGALDDVRAGLAEEGEGTSRSAAASVGPWEILLGRRYRRTRRRRFARRLSVHSGR